MGSRRGYVNCYNQGLCAWRYAAELACRYEGSIYDEPDRNRTQQIAGRSVKGWSRVRVHLRQVVALANNLWWSWHPEVTNLFRDLDPIRWRQLDHNPIALLAEFTPERLDIVRPSWCSTAASIRPSAG